MIALEAYQYMLIRHGANVDVINLSNIIEILRFRELSIEHLEHSVLSNKTNIECPVQIARILMIE